MKTAKPGIYEPLGMDGYELCHPVVKGGFEQISILMNGTPRLPSWRGIQMQIVKKDRGKRLTRSDSPWLGSHALVFRSSAIDVVGGILSRHGELLPLGCADAELCIYNVTNIIEAMDEDASSVVRFSNGQIMMIDRYALRAGVVADNDVFKVPSLRVSPTFVSHRFVDQWRASGLVGLDFTQIWEAGGS